MERESRCCLTLFIFVIFLKANVSASCTFPPGLEGTFDSTREGTLEFNTTTYGKFTISTQSQTFSDLEFECHIHSGTQYVSKSASFTIFSSDFYAYMCLDINQVSSNLYYYYYGTQPLPQANNARVKIYPISTVVGSVSTVCDEATPYTQPYSILLKNDSIATDEMQALPADLQGYFNYVLDDGSTNSCENETTYLDTCTNTSTLMFDYNICNRTTLYSDSGVLYCLYYNQPTTGTYYITLYNNDTTVDNTNTFRYTCVIFERGSDISYATQYPLECLNSTFMNSTTVTSPGGTLTLTHNGSCPIPTTMASTTVVAAAATVDVASLTGGVLGSLILLVVVLLIVIIIVKKKNNPNDNGGKMASKVQPEVKAFDRNSRPMFTPAPPKMMNGDFGNKDVAPGIIIDLESESDAPLSLEKDYTLPVFSENGDTPEPTILGSPFVRLEDADIAMNTPPPSTSPPEEMHRRYSSAKPNKKQFGSPPLPPQQSPIKKFAPVKDTAV